MCIVQCAHLKHAVQRIQLSRLFEQNHFSQQHRQLASAESQLMDFFDFLVLAALVSVASACFSFRPTQWKHSLSRFVSAWSLVRKLVFSSPVTLLHLHFFLQFMHVWAASFNRCSLRRANAKDISSWFSSCSTYTGCTVECECRMEIDLVDLCCLHGCSLCSVPQPLCRRTSAFPVWRFSTARWRLRVWFATCCAATVCKQGCVYRYAFPLKHITGRLCRLHSWLNRCIFKINSRKHVYL